MKRRLSLMALCMLSLCCIAQQNRSAAYLEYIATYAPMAQEQMRLHGVPASITLAQGLEESGAGQSMLAIKANNHFGIKVNEDWHGPYVLRDDDRPNDKFRKYDDVKDCFDDHSRFLSRPRYESLFRLDKTDYKGWAEGLRRCGYATNPAYPQKLIRLIELYDLQQYDVTDITQ